MQSGVYGLGKLPLTAFPIQGASQSLMLGTCATEPIDMPATLVTRGLANPPKQF
jgi:hypothetical protein